MSVQTDNSGSLMVEASNLARRGRFPDAERRCREVLRQAPQRADALLLLGVIELQTGRAEQAVRSIGASIRSEPDRPLAHALAGDALLSLGDPAQALQGYDAALRLGLRADSVYFGRGNALLDLGRLEDALQSYETTLRLRPAHAEALFNRGNALLALERFEAAVDSYDRAIALRPSYASAHNNRGSALLRLQRLTEALQSFDTAIAHSPQFADAWNNRGLTLIRVARMQEALAALDRAIELRSGMPEAHLARGNALRALARPLEALESYGAALRLRPGFPEAGCGFADTLLALGRADAAADSFAAVLRAAPECEFVAGALIHAQACIADWGERVSGVNRESIERAVLDGRRSDSPFSFLSVSASAAAQLHCARTYVASRCRPRTPMYDGRRYRHDRIRIAYLSADFREHALSYLLAGVWEKHDRRCFETFGVSFRPPESSPMGRRVSAAFSRFIDASAMSDDAVAERMLDLEIDIAVDLVGFTDGMRPDILASRPAPVQVSYLGFPATMGADFIDYLLTDRFVVTPETRAFFSERIVQLPDCFQANDDRRAMSSRDWSRGEVGLPEQAFVYCCLNNTCKINSQMFDVWMRILRAVPQSVLWLVYPGAIGSANLRREAACRGVCEDRIVFAPRWPYAEHLRRQRLADLFLDTLPFNGGTTVSDALYAGLPVVTCCGEAYASRMAASLLRTLGMPELATSTLPEYEHVAVALARSPQRLDAVRRQLIKAASTTPLFDSNRFRRHLEAAYRQMVAIHRREEPPQDFTVSAID